MSPTGAPPPVRGMSARALVLAVALLVPACHREAAGSRSERQPEAVRIVAHQVRYEREETTVEVVGTARARATATIYSETAGEVTEVLFRPGDFVEAGQPLVRLEAREEELAVRLADVAVAEAEQLLARYRRIEGTGAVSASQIDEARTALDAALIEQDLARLALEERTIEAPFSGFTGLTDVDPGARVTSTTVITQLDDRSSLYVDFAAPEQVFGRVALGDRVMVTPFADAGGDRRAEIIAIDSRIEPTRRTFTVRAEIPNEDDALRPGMSFRVSFSILGAEYPAVPEAAIVWGSDGAYVWGVVEGAAQRIPVTIVSRREGEVLVRGRIREGMPVVAEGVQKVREGSPVTDIGESGGLAARAASQRTGGAP